MKKGIHATYTVMGFVLLAVVLLVSTGLLLVLRDVFNQTQDDAQCATEIRAHATTVRFTNDLKAPKIVCPTKEVVVNVGEHTKQILADEMKRCWDMWGRGKLQLFGEEELIYCHVCSMVTVADNEIEGFATYLDTAKTTKGQTYSQYLMGLQDGEAFSGDRYPDAGSVTIPSGKPLGVIFFYQKGQDNLDAFYNAVLGNPVQGTLAGAGIGIVIAVAGPAGWLAGGVIVASATGAGFLASLFGREELDYMSAVVVRPLAVDEIASLGCTYAPVANA